MFGSEKKKKKKYKKKRANKVVSQNSFPRYLSTRNLNSKAIIEETQS
jgi:hypothetical protein